MGHNRVCQETRGIVFLGCGKETTIRSQNLPIDERARIFRSPSIESYNTAILPQACRHVRPHSAKFAGRHWIYVTLWGGLEVIRLIFIFHFLDSDQVSWILFSESMSSLRGPRVLISVFFIISSPYYKYSREMEKVMGYPHTLYLLWADNLIQ